MEKIKAASCSSYERLIRTIYENTNGLEEDLKDNLKKQDISTTRIGDLERLGYITKGVTYVNGEYKATYAATEHLMQTYKVDNLNFFQKIIGYISGVILGL